jgi:hypothetical protein
MFVTCIATDGAFVTNTRLEIQMIPQLEEIAHIEDTGGDSFSSMAYDDVLIVMDMIGGIRFYNISDPSNPTYMSYYDDGGIPHEMYKVGDLLYLADHYHGLEIYNISNPSNPIKLGSITDDGDGEMDGVFVKDELAYVAEWHDSTWDWSMKIINVTEPTTPVEVAEYTDDDNEFIRFFVRDEICFTACLATGFKILNVTEPNSIGEIAHFDDLYYAMEFQMVNDLAYIADGSGLNILDVSTLNTPTRIGNYNTGLRNSFDVKIVDDIAYLAVDETGLYILNISNPQDIVKIGEFLTEDITYVEVQGDLIFLTMHEYGVKILRETWVEGTADLSLPIVSIVVVLPILLIMSKKRRSKK